MYARFKFCPCCAASSSFCSVLEHARIAVRRVQRSMHLSCKSITSHSRGRLLSQILSKRGPKSRAAADTVALPSSPVVVRSAAQSAAQQKQSRLQKQERIAWPSLDMSRLHAEVAKNTFKAPACLN